MANLAFASSESVLAHDRFVAFRIDEERRRLFGASEAAIPTVVWGDMSYAKSGLTPAPAHFGVSMLAAERFRPVPFLSGQGVPVSYASAEQEAAAAARKGQIPPYPQPGWVSRVGDVMVVNLGSE